jgi:hypothetical protein
MVCQHHNVHLILYHGMFHLVTTFVCRLNQNKKIKIGEWCFGVTAVKDKMYIGCHSKVIILNTDGSRVREVKTDSDYIYSLMYNERNDQLLLRHNMRLCCIKLDG